MTSSWLRYLEIKQKFSIYICLIREGFKNKMMEISITGLTAPPPLYDGKKKLNFVGTKS
jgi:hypothetical protein